VVTVDFDDLELGKQLGKGAFGCVRSAIHSGADVAVKLLNKVTEESLADFEHEIVINSLCPANEHTVRMVGVAKGKQTGILMELYPLCSIEDVLKAPDSAQLDFPTLLRMAVHVSAGLIHLHTYNVVHRDIACRNALLKTNYTAAVGDFGLSLVLPEGKEEAVAPKGAILMNTSAPETLKGRRYSKQTDVYMFGLFLWELFARRQPFSGHPVLARCAQSKDWSEFRKLVCEDHSRPDIPGDWPSLLVSLIKHSWHRKPEQRFKMDQINSQLRTLLEDATKNRLPVPKFHSAFAESGADVEAAYYDDSCATYEQYDSQLE
jgi:serine/threonine protein kinase